MSQDALTAENRKQLAVKAIRRLLADCKSGRLEDNAELAEAIAACIRESGEQQLRSLECTSPCVLKVRSTAASLAQRERSAVATLLSRARLVTLTTSSKSLPRRPWVGLPSPIFTCF